MHLEILPPARPDDARARWSPDLEQGLLEVLRLVEEAVEDWQKMITRSEETDRAAQGPEARPTVASEEAALACELLQLAERQPLHLPRLPRVHSSDRGSGRLGCEPVPATGLGILRADADAPGAFHALPQPGTGTDLMIDHQGQRQVPGAPAGLPGLPRHPDVRRGRQRRRRAPVPRAVLLLAPTPRASPGSRCCGRRRPRCCAGPATTSTAMAARRSWTCWTPTRATSCSRRPIDELAPTVEKVAHLKERRQVRMFVRRDPYGRYLSCLVYLPRDRYTTAVRNRMQDILLRRLGGASIDYTARVTESVLARLHFVVRMPRRRGDGRGRRPRAGDAS